MSKAEAMRLARANAGQEFVVLCAVASVVKDDVKDKCLHGKHGDILIDDWEKYMHLWKGMGGHWITHISAESSIAKLIEHLDKTEVEVE